MSTSTYIVMIDGVGTGTSHATFEDAAREWDRMTFYRPAKGGIELTVRDSRGNAVRQASLIHVHENGRVYVNPNLGVVQ